MISTILGMMDVMVHWCTATNEIISLNTKSTMLLLTVAMFVHVAISMIIERRRMASNIAIVRLVWRSKAAAEFMKLPWPLCKQRCMMQFPRSPDMSVQVLYKT